LPDDLGAQLVDLIDAAAEPVTFDEVHAREIAPRRGRSRVAAAVAIAAVIFVPIAAAVVITRDRHTTAVNTPAPVASAPTSPSVPPSGDPVDALPKLPDSAIKEFRIPSSLDVDNAFVADESLWLTGVDCHVPTCPGRPTLYRLDRSSGTFAGVSYAEVGGIAVAYADGSLYSLSDLVDGGPYKVTRVDLPSGQERYMVDVPDTHVYGNTNPRGRIAAGFGSVWVYEGNDFVARLDADTGTQTARIKLPPNTSSNGLAVNSSGVWSIPFGGTDLVRIDPNTNVATDVTEFPVGFAQSVAADDSWVWTTHAAPALDLARVDASDPTMVDSTGIPTAAVATGDGEAWFLGWIAGEKADSPRNHPGLVGRIDPQTLEVTGVAELPIGAIDDTRLVVGDGAAWVVDSTTHRIWRVESS
jgi:hypothetical protein